MGHDLVVERTAGVIEHWSRQPGRAVLFDFNGTLSNDEPILLRLYQEISLERLGRALDPDHYIAELLGRSDREIFERLAGESGLGPELVDELLELRSGRYLELAAEQNPIEDRSAALVEALLEEGVTVGIVTGAPRVEVIAVLEGRGMLECFAAIVTEDEVEASKPDPEGYLLAAAQLGLQASSTLVFEDSVPGLRAARAAGMTAIGEVGSGSADLLGPEAAGLVDSLDPELVAGI
jgi:HAD superfamily hydrolase (TIGR01509 family)